MAKETDGSSATVDSEEFVPTVTVEVRRTDGHGAGTGEQVWLTGKLSAVISEEPLDAAAVGVHGEKVIIAILVGVDHDEILQTRLPALEDSVDGHEGPVSREEIQLEIVIEIAECQIRRSKADVIASARFEGAVSASTQKRDAVGAGCVIENDVVATIAVEIDNIEAEELARRRGPTVINWSCERPVAVAEVH